MPVQSKQPDEWVAVCANAGTEKPWLSFKFDPVLKSLPQTTVDSQAHRFLVLVAA